jgi:DNA-binding beta-propeller fold protein YncE
MLIHTRSLLTGAFILSVLLIAFMSNGAQTMAASAGLSPCGGMPPIEATPTPFPPATPVAAGAPMLQTVADVPLSGNADRFDYQDFEPDSGRLYIAHMGSGQLIVFDTRAQAIVSTVDGLPGVTGVLAVPDLHAIYASITGAQEVVVIDDQTLEVVARLGPIKFPDGLDYSPETKQVYVSDESGGGELVIDATTNTVTTTIDVGGAAGNTHYDPVSGCILVAAQSQHQLVSIDPRSNEITSHADLGSTCQNPHGFLIDSGTRMAFVSCAGNAQLLTVDLASLGIIGTTSAGDTPDVLAFDSGLRRLYVAAESGTVTVFDEQGGALLLLGQFEMPHAHSVAVDSKTHLVYFPLENINGTPVLRIMKPSIPIKR